MIPRMDILARRAMLTGSVAFGVALHGSDEDWLIESTDAGEFCGVPWPLCIYEGAKDGFFCYREGKYNLIVFECHGFKLAWLRAHRHCLIERPKDKARRIKIFRHYLYGEGFLT